MKGIEFIFDSVDLLHHYLQKIKPDKKGGSYLDSPNWLKNKKEPINRKNHDVNCFQYAILAALNHKQIKSHPERISNFKFFIDQYDLKEIEFHSHTPKDWKKFESNSKPIALNILFVLFNIKNVIIAYKSKHTFKRQNHVTLLMITDGKKWHYLAVKRLSALLREITSNHNGDFYCLNCFQSYSTKNKLKKHERVCNDYDYCYVEIPNEDNKILKHNHREKSLIAPSVISSDLKCLFEKIHLCQNNPEKSSTTKKYIHTPSGC